MSHRLFVGFTRPATKLGLPLIALALIIYVCMVAFIMTKSLYVGIFGIGAYSLCRLAIIYDPRFFEVIFSRGKLKGAQKFGGFMRGTYRQ